MALYYEESHTGARETILWLHGGGMSGWMWHPQVDALPEYHAIVPDLPEHGRSLRERPFSIDKTADQLARLIEQHGHYSRAHVVGLSVGAQVALQLLARYPERVGRVILSGMAVRPAPERQGPFAKPLKELSLRATLPLRHARFLVEAAMRAKGVPEHHWADFAADMRRLSPGAYRRVVLREGLGSRLPEGLATSCVPTLLVAGERERPEVLQSARDLLEAMPCAQGAIAQGLGHSWNLQEPERFTAMVRAWLSQSPLPPGLMPLTPSER